MDAPDICGFLGRTKEGGLETPKAPDTYRFTEGKLKRSFDPRQLLIHFGSMRAGSILGEMVELGKRAESLKKELEAIVEFSEELLDNVDKAEIDRIRHSLYRLGVFGDTPVQNSAPLGDAIPPGITLGTLKNLLSEKDDSESESEPRPRGATPRDAETLESLLGGRRRTPDKVDESLAEVGYLRDLVGGMDRISELHASNEKRHALNNDYITRADAKKQEEVMDWLLEMRGKAATSGRGFINLPVGAGATEGEKIEYAAPVNPHSFEPEGDEGPSAEPLA